MKRKFIIGIVLSVLVIPNTPVIGTEILKAIDGDHFRYANCKRFFYRYRVHGSFSPLDEQVGNIWIYRGYETANGQYGNF
ncbi:hypothetical protein [uncultured Sphingobacterium sp.]|uniref:hypothetical protein n=1 Tax=uncultured Sphingobacterium sp. TaxID=182688 RepID=UPI003749C1D3